MDREEKTLLGHLHRRCPLGVTVKVYNETPFKEVIVWS